MEFFENAEIDKGEYYINGRIVLEACHRRVTKFVKSHDRLRAFIESFLNPEENGLAVSARIRDEARDVLGMERVEFGKTNI